MAEKDAQDIDFSLKLREHIQDGELFTLLSIQETSLLSQFTNELAA